MEAVAATHAYVTYQPLAKLIARRHRPLFGSLDNRGRGVDDYRQELRLKAIDVAVHFQKAEGFCLPAERRYVAKSMWNLARNWRRSQHSGPVCGALDNHADSELGSYQIEPQLEARHLVRVLVEALPPHEVELLGRLIQADGVIGRAWDPKIDGKRRLFERRVEKLREKARTITGLQNS